MWLVHRGPITHGWGPQTGLEKQPKGGGRGSAGKAVTAALFCTCLTSQVRGAVGALAHLAVGKASSNPQLWGQNSDSKHLVHAEAAPTSGNRCEKQSGSRTDFCVFIMVI